MLQLLTDWNPLGTVGARFEGSKTECGSRNSFLVRLPSCDLKNWCHIDAEQEPAIGYKSTALSCLQKLSHDMYLLFHKQLLVHFCWRNVQHCELEKAVWEFLWECLWELLFICWCIVWLGVFTSEYHQTKWWQVFPNGVFKWCKVFVVVTTFLCQCYNSRMVLLSSHSKHMQFVSGNQWLHPMKLWTHSVSNHKHT